jgi:hypothetical protein
MGPNGDGSNLDDVFPPARAVSSIDCDSSLPLRLAYGNLDNGEENDLGEYAVDDLLGVTLDNSNQAGADVDPELLDWLNDPLGASDGAWERLGLDGYEGEWDDVSDSESVGGWGFMRFGEDVDGRVGEEGEDVDERSRHEWEHIRCVSLTLSFSSKLANSALDAAPKPSPPSKKNASPPKSPTLPAHPAAARAPVPSPPPSDQSSSTGTMTGPPFPAPLAAGREEQEG